MNIVVVVPKKKKKMKGENVKIQGTPMFKIKLILSYYFNSRNLNFSEFFNIINLINFGTCIALIKMPLVCYFVLIIVRKVHIFNTHLTN